MVFLSFTLMHNTMRKLVTKLITSYCICQFDSFTCLLENDSNVEKRVGEKTAIGRAPSLAIYN